MAGSRVAGVSYPFNRRTSLLYTDFVTCCYIVIFRISKRNSDPFGRI